MAGKKWFLVLLSCATSFISVAANQPDQHSIVWYHPDFPPANFVDSLLEGLGYADQIQKFISQRMPEYRHYKVSASYQRILHNIRYDQGCTIGLYKDKQRDNYLQYSVPMLLTFPNGLVVRKNDAKKFNNYVDEQGYMKFEQLLKVPNLLIGVADGRSYSKQLDGMIAEKHKSNNVLLRSGENVFGSLLQMLDRKRVDYILGFPEELAYHTSLGVLQHEMKFYPIKEQAKYELSYVACSQNQWGQKVIEQVNAILLAERDKPEFLRFFQFWLDFDSKKRHNQLSTEFFGASNTKKAH